MTLGTELDHLDLGPGRRIVIVDGPNGRAALPAVLDGQTWRRAHPGDGVAEAMLATLCGGTRDIGRFTVTSWSARTAAGERAITADQTNESVVVGDAAIVKWATHLQDGPHPAPHRIGALRAAGFTGMPAPWGLLTWRPPEGAETLAATVDEYLPGAVDGWTWAVESITGAARGDERPVQDAATAVGTLVAELHAALAGTAATAGADDATQWREEAFSTLEAAAAVQDSACTAVLTQRRAQIEEILHGLGALAGSTVVDGHGDLHVGQVLRAGGRFFITDFDGNPVLAAAARVRPIPAVLDVAGMVQSLAHAAIVARKYTELDPVVLARVDVEARSAFLAAYAERLAALGHTGLYDPAALRALRLQQVLREIVYAAHHLPRWMYVPAAALPALLDETPASAPAAYSVGPQETFGQGGGRTQ